MKAGTTGCTSLQTPCTLRQPAALTHGRARLLGGLQRPAGVGQLRLQLRQPRLCAGARALSGLLVCGQRGGLRLQRLGLGGCLLLRNLKAQAEAGQLALAGLPGRAGRLQLGGQRSGLARRLCLLGSRAVGQLRQAGVELVGALLHGRPGRQRGLQLGLELCHAASQLLVRQLAGGAKLLQLALHPCQLGSLAVQRRLQAVQRRLQLALALLDLPGTLSLVQLHLADLLQGQAADLLGGLAWSKGAQEVDHAG